MKSYYNLAEYYSTNIGTLEDDYSSYFDFSPHLDVLETTYKSETNLANFIDLINLNFGTDSVVSLITPTLIGETISTNAKVVNIK